MKKKSRRLILSIVVTLILLLLLTFTVTYAIFTYRQNGTSNQKLVLGDIWMNYNETNALSIENAMPGDDYSEYFEFTITGKNTYTEQDIYYDIILSNGDTPDDKLDTNRIDSKYLKFKLVEVNDDNTEKIIFTNKTYNHLNDRRVHVETISKNTTNEYNKKYRIYMAISNNLVIGNTSDAVFTIESWQDAFASVKVNVSGDFNIKQMPGTMARLGTSSLKFWSDEIENVEGNIKEVNFIQLDNSEIDTRYNAATIKSDVTTVEEYPIKAWLETNATDSTMYTMYVASEEEIYFPSDKSDVL